MSSDNRFETLKLDYEKSCEYFNKLHETRFRLLAFLPTLAGVAAVLVPKNTSATGELLIGVLGFLIVIGITIYDQRNTQIYDRLVTRLKFLEKEIGFISLNTNNSSGRIFTERPGRRKLIGINIIWHDAALAIVYSASLLIWTFLILDSIFKYLFCNRNFCTWLMLVFILLFVCILFFFAIIYLSNLNDKEKIAIENKL